MFKRKSRSKVRKENKLCDDFFANLERGCDIVGHDDSTFDELMELVRTNPCASGWFLRQNHFVKELISSESYDMTHII